MADMGARFRERLEADAPSGRQRFVGTHGHWPLYADVDGRVWASTAGGWRVFGRQTSATDERTGA